MVGRNICWWVRRRVVKKGLSCYTGASPLNPKIYKTPK